MTDRELLELAAKAAGYFVSFEPHMSMQCEDGIYHMHDRCFPSPTREGSHWWNPLLDDGDAFRLMVKVGVWPVRGRVIPGDWSESNFIRVVLNGMIAFDEIFTDDPCAATRRAIVRAAAEIGKESKS